MYVSCMFHVLIHAVTYMKPFSDTWKVHEISCIMYWQILKLLLIIYSIISAIKFKKLQVDDSLNIETLKETLVNLIKLYTF